MEITPRVAGKHGFTPISTKSLPPDQPANGYFFLRSPIILHICHRNGCLYGKRLVFLRDATVADSNRLAEVVALMAERDDEYRPFLDVAVHPNGGDLFWSISDLKELLGYQVNESIDAALNRAKIAASRSNWTLKDHFKDGDLFDNPGEVYLSKYAAFLVTMNADVEKTRVALAQSFFALQVDRQRLEDEKRLKNRLDVATENNKLAGTAKAVGVVDFQKFNGVGFSALYGGRNVSQVKRLKGIPENANHYDFSGSEELAANLFRITQTSAALKRQTGKSEAMACDTHKKVASGVRRAIIDAGNTPPEQLPAAKTKIDLVATQVKKQLKKT